MAAGIDFDRLRQAVFLRHNIALTPDDPVLVTITLNELVLAHYVEILNARNEAHQAALTAALQTQITQSKDTAGRVITEAADYVSDQARKAIATALADALARLQRDVAAAPKTPPGPAAPPASRIANLNMVTLVATFIAGALAALAVVTIVLGR